MAEYDAVCACMTTLLRPLLLDDSWLDEAAHGPCAQRWHALLSRL